jgi:hypothetical protein
MALCCSCIDCNAWIENWRHKFNQKIAELLLHYYNYRHTQTPKHDLKIQVTNSVTRCRLLLFLTCTLCLYRQPTQQVGMALGYSCMGCKAWAEDWRHKFNQKNAETPTTPLQLSPYTGCKALPWRFKTRIQSEDAACFWLEYELLLVQAANKLAWRVTTTVAQTLILCEVKPSLLYNHSSNLFICTWIQGRSRRRTGALHT